MPPDVSATGPVERRLRQKIEETFSPERCSIANDSPAHSGHAGAREAANKGESHFSVNIVSQRFEGLSRLERNRAVHRCLAEEIPTIHALVLDLKTPKEASQPR